MNYIITKKHKGILDLILYTIDRPLPTNFNRNRYFINLINNVIKKGWTIYISNRKSISIELDKWKAIIEFEIGKKLKVLKVNNIIKLIIIIFN